MDVPMALCKPDRAGKSQRKPGEAGSPMRIGKSLTHRTGRRRNAPQGEGWPPEEP
jgi:hypothetical protein